MGYIKSDIRRLCRSRAWYIGVAGVVFALFFAMEGRGFENGSLLFHYVFVTHLSGIMITFIFCAAPFATVFCEDLEQQYIRCAVIRGNFKKYVCSKCAVIYASSVITMLCGTLLYLLICRTQVPWIRGMEDISGTATGCYSTLAENGHYLGYCMMYALHLGMLSGVFSLMAAFASIYISNRVLILILPALLYQVTMRININGYSCYIFYAKNKIFEQDWINFLFIFGLSAFLSVAAAAGIYKKLKKRV